MQPGMPPKLPGARHGADHGFRRLIFIVVLADVEAGAAHPEPIERVKFRVRHIVFDDCNSTYARAVFQGRECVYEETVVRVVGHGVYNDAAREPDLAKNILHVAEGRVRRFVESCLLCRVLGGVCINMKLTIAAERGRRRIGPSCLSVPFQKSCLCRGVHASLVYRLSGASSRLPGHMSMQSEGASSCTLFKHGEPAVRRTPLFSCPALITKSY